MAGKRKIIKKKLKEPDEFITITERTFIFIKKHFKPILTGGIIVLVILLTAFFYQRWTRSKEEDAGLKLNLAVEAYQMASSPYREGAPQDYKNVLKKFDEVITNFPRTSSGKLSLLYEGAIHLQLGEFEEAIKAYQTFLQKGGKEKLYRLFATEGLGYAYEGKKDYEKALNTFQKIVEMGESVQLADAYLNMGFCYEKLGKTKEAVDHYKSFLRVSPKSEMANAILRKVSYLEK
jgi:tetratricopeptide (TPR) repeat protein